VKAYVIHANTVIPPFNDPPRKCLILNQELWKVQDDVPALLGLDSVRVTSRDEVPRGEERLTFYDNRPVWDDALKEYIDKSKQIGTSTVRALKRGLVTLRSVVGAKVCVALLVRAP